MRNRATARDALVRAGVAGVVLILPFVFLAERAVRDPKVFFLAAHRGAEWIQLRLPPSLGKRANEQFAPVARFAHEFELAAVPPDARLEIRALREWRARVNGVEFAPTAPADDWKLAESIAVGHALQVGVNRLEVMVRCKRGPPSLWLRGRALPPESATGPGWTVAPWGGQPAPAALATAPLPQPFDGEPVGALATAGREAYWLGALFVASALAFALREHIAGRMSRRLSGRARKLATAPNVATLLATAAWLAVAIASAVRDPQPLGSDVIGHLAYLEFLVKHHALPLATSGWSTYHPPLFYVLSALVWVACGGAQLVLKLLPFAAGLGQVLLVRWVAGRAFPERPAAQAVAVAFAAVIPMNLYVAQFFTNEGLAAFLIGLTICYAMALTEREHGTRWEFATLGLFGGLALLTKYSALVALIGVLAVLAADQVERRRRVKDVAASLGAFAGVALIVAGWYYARNLVRLGALFPGNWEFEWWQDPGFHTSAYWTRVGGWLANPFKIGLNSFPDSLYATFWGDAMMSGATGTAGVAGFDRVFVAAVMLVAAPALVLLAIGAVRALAQVVRDGSMLWSLVLLPTLGLLTLIAYASLNHPYYSTAKAFFALGALVPFALLLAAGFQTLDELAAARAPALRVVLHAWLGTLAGCVFLAYLG